MTYLGIDAINIIGIMQQSASPHVTKLVDLILIEVFLLAEILQKGNRYCHVMSCHVMSCDLH